MKSRPSKTIISTRRRTMDDLLEDFNSTKASEIAVGVFVALVAFKVAGAIARACLE